ncbi:low molecular weight phosphotyrosine protein phosphatase [Paracoccus aurantiacus]|uniref:protein-tyrosine-phosphatase n=1 Tax=Paracoccus aurantiacus TaxID=2599412 RepID=A0A5C6S8U1_9RHOB|nr:low molecular weight protein-tyrosine-phosphatase [Paracoccus aurantiacus]TXB70522.1 low molecular weight phosphotyrosine protein phosphatase [Paracoccus aurantiacus]
MSTPSILFVCLGNICRSPMAEGAMRDAARRAGVQIRTDSAGTGSWHIGAPPDRRAQSTAAKHGTDISDLRGRQIDAQDFYDFDHIIAMDAENMADLRSIAPRNATARLSLILDHVPGQEGRSVADPYHGGLAEFAAAWQQVAAGAAGLLGKLGEPKHKSSDEP